MRKLYRIYCSGRLVVDTQFFHEANFFMQLTSSYYVVEMIQGVRLIDFQPIPLYKVFQSQAAKAAKDKK